jgi:hypothetical protein
LTGTLVLPMNPIALLTKLLILLPSFYTT